MDASEGGYYPFDNDGHAPGNDPRHCSVRGCTHLVTDGSQNKMCDTCRGRHRLYASTKRARRKLEKAAVAARNGQEPLDPGPSPSQDGVSSPVVTAASWMSGNEVVFHEEIPPSNPHLPVAGPSSSISPSLLSVTWNQSIDPRLFAEDTLTSSSRPLPLHQTSSSSELANALTLPPPRPQIQVEPVPDTNRVPEERNNEDKEGQSTPAPSDATPQDSADGSTRNCSVKGCKSTLPPTYEYKMCPPCRTRYRTYGNTKRAKWKTEREAFDRDMAGLRASEDKRRELEGLPPLADNPDELRAWELSIIDEQIPEAGDVVSDMSPLVSMAGTSQQPAPESSSSVYTSPMLMAGVYPATTGSIDSPHSISPYPHIGDPSHIPGSGPFPARMCTVSHCHKILPGYYRYKRCEQHRLQNRHHSKLKRVREKGIKASGPGEDAASLEGKASSTIVPSEVGNSDTSDEDATALKSRKDDKGKGKAIEESSSIATAIVNTEESSLGSPSTMQLWPNTTIPKPDINRLRPEPKSRAKMQQLSRYSCANDDCENLLTPGIRWRTCEECRDKDRLRKFTVRAELKEAENAYWKGVAQSLSAARKAKELAESSSTTPQASGQSAAPGVPSSSVGDEDDDADGDSDVPDEEQQMNFPAFTLVYDSASANTSVPIIRATVSGPTSSSAPHTAPPTTSVPAHPPAPISVVAPTTTLSEASSSASTQFSSTFGNTTVENPNTPKVQTYYRKERMELQPPMHHSPTFNSLTKQQRAQNDAVPVVNGQFSKFRVQLLPDSAAPHPTQMTAPQMFLPMPVAVDNGHASVDTSKATTEAHAANDASTHLRKTETSSANAVEIRKEVPTLTIPTSVPFVYNPPVKKFTKEVKATTSVMKSKKKPASKNIAPNGGMPALAFPANSMSAPPGSFGSYGFPPPYPYYPYYMPPYPFSPLSPVPPTTSFNNKGNSQPVGSTSAAQAPGAPNFFPYPYPPPQPYSIGTPPGVYPYLPPRYTLTGHNAASGQQPYPALPPPMGPFKGYPYFVPPPGPSSSALPPTAAAAMPTTGSAPVSEDPQSQQPLPEPTTKPPEPEAAAFTYHHLGTDSFAAVTDKPTRKRRKVDPHYLEKHKALQAERLASVSNVDSSVPPATMPETSAEDVSIGLPTEDVEQTTDSESEPNGGQSNDMNAQSCATKACRRTLPVDAVGKICEKCKLRIKKHQSKTKRKFKLEPRKYLLAKDVTGAHDEADVVANETL